ncbi:HyaD/HybD family hydrogenase maturation endopeptidase [Desulfoplanes sp.]
MAAFREKTPRILILGVGNILFTDEGIGVRAVNYLIEKYTFSDNVTLRDGSTLGIELMDPIMQCDHLVVLDAVLGDEPPGSIYRLTGEDLRKSISFRNSMHQTDLVDTLIFCRLAGKCPEAVIIGMEPEDMETMSIELSSSVRERIPLMAVRVLEEIENLGEEYDHRVCGVPQGGSVCVSRFQYK